MHAIVELVLRTVAVVSGVLGAALGAAASAAYGITPGSALPLVAVAVVAVAGVGVGVALAAVAVAVIIARAGTLLLGGTRLQAGVPDRRRPDIRTRIAWSHPDADGHVRPRGPGGVPAT